VSERSAARTRVDPDAAGSTMTLRIVVTAAPDACV